MQGRRNRSKEPLEEEAADDVTGESPSDAAEDAVCDERRRSWDYNRYYGAERVAAVGTNQEEDTQWIPGPEDGSGTTFLRSVIRQRWV